MMLSMVWYDWNWCCIYAMYDIDCFFHSLFDLFFVWLNGTAATTIYSSVVTAIVVVVVAAVVGIATVHPLALLT